jgi:DNA helicase-2/ATP-dependent DNA helicase PcrA
MTPNLFDQEYGKLNKAQREAVDSINGPVMVVAGPGTGKTQILALRIGNILKKTDTKPDGILCLTFTNSAVKAMKDRLYKYIGAEAFNVKVATFHSFGMEILSKYYPVLNLEVEPKLMDEKDSVVLCDDILNNNDWEYLRPRGDSARYFHDLKSLVSLLKRERITPKDFEDKIKDEIKNLETDEDNISTRGASKGELKKDIQKKIEGLGRSLEAMKFYSLYETEKKKLNLFDYDDILESLNIIVSESEDALNYIKENFLYVLIDEHQDSSGVQNSFLQKVWGGVESPDIFVVGDDRQLIYGFGGASLEYFENFKNAFGRAKLITLVENYRSTNSILDLSHDLLQSSITKEKLKSNHKEDHNIRLVEAYYPRDEIISCALEIKEKIKQGHSVNDMAILVPKNRQVRSTITILKDMDIPVSDNSGANFFETPAAQSFLNILRVINNPNDGVSFAKSFFDTFSKIPPLDAHVFLKDKNMRDFSFTNLSSDRSTPNSLFDQDNKINVWLKKIKSWLSLSNESLYSLVQKVGTEFLLDSSSNHKELVVNIEILRTLLHLVLMQTERDLKITLGKFLNFIDRVESYGESIPLSVFGSSEGVRVLTLHGSKGLEFDYVWIAHMDEKSFSGSKVGGFSLPESVKEKLENKDVEVLKRQLYVAITRAKRFCTISYALKSYTGADQELAHVVLPLVNKLSKQEASVTESIILKEDPRLFVSTSAKGEERVNLKDLVKLVARDYEDRKVSVSLLNNFFECPWKWYFRNLLQLPESKSESLEFGNKVHGAIDKILKLKKVPKEISQKELEEMAEGDREVLKILTRWVEDRLPFISKSRENEQSVSVSDDRFPHLNIYGKIDLIENLDEHNVRVTDFKTGGVRKKGDIEKIDEDPTCTGSSGEARRRMSGYMRQLAMYSYLLTKNKKWNVAVSESRLEFLEAKDKKEIFYDTVITKEQIGMIVEDIVDYDKFIKTGEWIERPCHYNSYGKNTECEYCKMSEIYKY